MFMRVGCKCFTRFIFLKIEEVERWINIIKKSINEIIEENEFVSVSGKMVSDLTVKTWHDGNGENLILF